MKHLVIIGLTIPEPQSTAAGSRMMQLITLFQKNSYRISFLSSAKETDFSEKIAFQKIELNHHSFDEIIKELNPDIVLFDRFITEEQFGWRVSEQCPNALKILDTEDLHFLRETRRKAFFEGKEIKPQDYINQTFKREIASILRCDLSIIISEYEWELLTKTFGISQNILFYLPFISDEKPPKTNPYNERKNFVSIGNFLHEPNWQTVLKLKQIWKNIRKKLPNTELHIYGAYASEKVFQLHNESEGFIIKGRAESVENTFRKYRVLLAPIPFGAGLKGKLWESMLYGIPNITSPIGAEGMHGNLSWNGYVEDNDMTFIEKSIELHENEQQWLKAQQNGYIILEQRFNKNDFENLFFQRINEIENNFTIHRTENFLGQVLQHHSLQSTKFMSKWIEEKNK
ncbi:MAG: glycosyltransferase [Cruoricaptor ignavus]|nr:glycosyltransferase [Cruoricaptor ignavus]